MNFWQLTKASRADYQERFNNWRSPAADDFDFTPPKVTENWELPSEYRQYAEMIAVWNLSLLDRAWQEWRDAEGFASFPGKTYSVRPTPTPSKDDNSESDDWVGLQPPRPAPPWGTVQLLDEAIKSIGADPRSESLAKALRFT